MKTYWIEYVPVNWRSLGFGRPKWEYVFESLSESFNETNLLFSRLCTTHKSLSLRIVSSTDQLAVWRIPANEIPFVDPHIPSTTYQFRSRIQPIEIKI